MLFRKIIIMFALSATLIGCGFQPMLKSETEGKQSFVLNVKGEGYPAYIFRREMEKQLSLVPQLRKQTYRIDVSLSGADTPSAIAQDATVTRVKLTYVARYRLSTNDSKPVTQSTAATTSYSVIPRNIFTSRNADTAAKSRLMVELAQDVALEIVRNIKQDDLPSS